MGMRSPIFQPNRSAVLAPDDGALAILQKGFHWSSGTISSGIHLALVFGIDHELGKEILFVLVDAAEPIVVGDVFHAGNAQNLVAIRERNGLDDGQCG